MNRTVLEKLVAIASRRELTKSERDLLDSLLAENPELRATWHDEEQLNALLRMLPEPQVSTNFTARVLDQVQANKTPHRAFSLGEIVRATWPWRFAWRFAAVLLVTTALVVLYQWRLSENNSVESLLATLPATGLAEVDLWTDFEVIRQLPPEPLPSVFALAEALK